jgi:hypothetical protein
VYEKEKTGLEGNMEEHASTDASLVKFDLGVEGTIPSREVRENESMGTATTVD